MNAHQASQILEVYTAAWPRYLTTESLPFWHRQLQRLDFDDCSHALARLIETRTKAPSLAEIRETTCGIAARRSRLIDPRSPFRLTPADRTRGLQAAAVIRQMLTLARQGKPFEHLAPPGDNEPAGNCQLCEDRAWVEHPETREVQPCRRCRPRQHQQWAEGNLRGAVR